MRFIYVFILTVIISPAVFSQNTGTLSGRVVDQNDALVPGAILTATSADGIEKTATTNADGEFIFTGLPIGIYKVRAAAKNFAPYENANVAVTAGNRRQLTISLTISIERQEVSVSNENQVNTDPNNNKSAIVLRGDDIKALPEDPDELLAALQALAGPSAGPNGGEIYIDGFTGGRLPPQLTW